MTPYFILTSMDFELSHQQLATQPPFHESRPPDCDIEPSLYSLYSLSPCSFVDAESFKNLGFGENPDLPVQPDDLSLDPQYLYSTLSIQRNKDSSIDCWKIGCTSSWFTDVAVLETYETDDCQSRHYVACASPKYQNIESETHPEQLQENKASDGLDSVILSHADQPTETFVVPHRSLSLFPQNRHPIISNTNKYVELCLNNKKTQGLLAKLAELDSVKKYLQNFSFRFQGIYRYREWKELSYRQLMRPAVPMSKDIDIHSKLYYRLSKSANVPCRCTVCHLSFHSLWSLIKHKDTAGHYQKWACPLERCPFHYIGFSEYNDACWHYCTHSGTSIGAWCITCKSPFNRADSLKRHNDNVHRDMRLPAGSHLVYTAVSCPQGLFMVIENLHPSKPRRKKLTR